MDKELEKLIESARARTMSEAEIANQKVAFAYGNAPKGDTNTKDSARKAILEGDAITRKN